MTAVLDIDYFWNGWLQFRDFMEMVANKLLVLSWNGAEGGTNHGVHCD